MEIEDQSEHLDRYHKASFAFNSSPTPDNAEELLKAFEAMSGAGAAGWGAVRRIKKAESIYLADGRRGAEDIPL